MQIGKLDHAIAMPWIGMVDATTQPQTAEPLIGTYYCNIYQVHGYFIFCNPQPTAMHAMVLPGSRMHDVNYIGYSHQWINGSMGPVHCTREWVSFMFRTPMKSVSVLYIHEKW